MLVVSVILMILFYVVYLFLKPGLRVWKKSDRKVTLQQGTLVGLRMIVNDLGESNTNSVKIYYYNIISDHVSTLICMASARNNSGVLQSVWANDGHNDYDTGQLIWTKFIIYYHDYKYRLRRCSGIDFAANKTPKGMQLSVDPITLIHIENVSADRIIARNIEKVEFNYEPSETDWKGWISIRIEAKEQQLYEDEACATNLQTSVEVRYNDLQE